MVRIDEMPDPKTHPEEFKMWSEIKRMNHYWETHEERIEWGNEIVAPEELWGGWLDVKYVTNNGREFHWQKKDIENWKPLKESMGNLVSILDNTFNLLGREMGWWSPYIIQIDDKGHFNLLYCKKVRDGETDGTTVSVNQNLRLGRSQTYRTKL